MYVPTRVKEARLNLTECKKTTFLNVMTHTHNNIALIGGLYSMIRQQRPSPRSSATIGVVSYRSTPTSKSLISETGVGAGCYNHQQVIFTHLFIILCVYVCVCATEREGESARDASTLPTLGFQCHSTSPATDILVVCIYNHACV